MFYFSNGIEPSAILAKVTYNASLKTYKANSIDCTCPYGIGDSTFKIESDDDVSIDGVSPVIIFDSEMDKDQTLYGTCVH